MSIRGKFYVPLFLLLCASLIGCTNKASNEKKYTSYIEDYASDGICSGAELNFWTGDYYIDDCEKEAEIQVADYSMQGKYRWSTCGFGFSFSTDYYDTTERASFGIRHDNKQVVYANFRGKTFDEAEEQLEDDSDIEKNCLLIAQKAIVDFVGKTDGYELAAVDKSDLNKKREDHEYTVTYYTVRYIKKIQEYDSRDFISVRVNSRGQLISVALGDIGAYDSFVTDIDAAAVEKSVNKKVKAFYSELGYHINDTKIISQTLAKAPDDNFYIVSDVEIFLAIDGRNQKTALMIATLIE